MFRYWMRMALAGVAATGVWMAVAAGTPALADDPACVDAGLFGEAFGLCDAYCEAMDCDGDTPQASAMACQKVQTKFDALDIEPLPCLGDPPLNNAPVVDLSVPDGTTFDTTATFVSFGDAVPIAVDVEITDSDGDTIISATVTLTNPIDDPEETLSLSPAGHDLLAGLFGGAVAGEGTDTLLITGEGTLDQYSDILQEVVYDNALGDPDTTDRMIVVEVDDGFIDGFSDATSVMAVTVGCPCPAFTSDAIIDTDLVTYVPTRTSREGCSPSGVNCYNSTLPSAFISPQTKSCTQLFDTTPLFQFDYFIQIHAFASAPIADQRFFSAKVTNDACRVWMGGGRGAGPVTLSSLDQLRSDSNFVTPFQFVGNWSSAMTDACVAALPSLRAKLLNFWEGADGIARLPRCKW